MEKHQNFNGCPLEVDAKNDISKEILNYKQIINPKVLMNETISLSFDILTSEIYEVYNTYTLNFLSQKIYIPPGELYGDYEKMFLPFDLSTWIGISLMASVSLIAIVLIKWLSPNNQEIYFGRNNRSPLMNFISIMINGTQPTNLIENTPRIFLLIFIFWSLIFR
jgi:hypothetical protein